MMRGGRGCVLRWEKTACGIIVFGLGGENLVVYGRIVGCRRSWGKTEFDETGQVHSIQIKVARKGRGKLCRIWLRNNNGLG